MDNSFWAKLLLVLAPPLITAFVSTISSITNNAPSPTRWKYWADELPVRIELVGAN